MAAVHDAVMLASAEALSRWRRPSASAWALLGPGAIRLALGGPLSESALHVAVADIPDLEEVVTHLHVVAGARVSSRLGCSFDAFVADGAIVVRAVEEGQDVRLEFPQLVAEESLAQRQRWPIARLHSDAWPGWAVATLVATPKLLLADAVRRCALGDAAGEADVRWLMQRGVGVCDADALAALVQGGGSQVAIAACARELGVVVDAAGGRSAVRRRALEPGA